MFLMHFCCKIWWESIKAKFFTLNVGELKEFFKPIKWSLRRNCNLQEITTIAQRILLYREKDNSFKFWLVFFCMYNSLSSQICSSSWARKTSTGYVWLTIIISDISLVRDKSIYKILRRKSCFDAGLWGTGFESCVLILSCSLARHFNLVTPLPTQERKWVLVNR